jgi:hypothetical protein
MRTRDFLSALLGVILLIGCSSAPQRKAEPKRVQNQSIIVPVKEKAPDPAKTALEGIIRQYKAEFAKAAFLEPGKGPALAGAVEPKSYQKTLRTIRAFDQQYGTRSREHARLTVLRGMIHLQTGQFRSASAMEPEMIKAASLLSNPSDLNRGGLVARNFKHLVTGWSEIYKYHENLKARNAGKLFPFPSTDFGKIQEAADQISENLRRYAKENPQLVRDPESDLGGLHVAAIAAAFYTSVQRNNDRSCVYGTSKECTAKKRENKEKGVFYKKGRDLIGLFLTETEKNSAVRGQHMTEDMSPCHLRYLSWYGWLSKRVHDASIRNVKKKSIASS